MEKMEEATVVIVLPAYNAAKTLLLTLKEIPAEFREHIILVDDASQDNTVEIAKKAGIKVFQHEKNLGVRSQSKNMLRTSSSVRSRYSYYASSRSPIRC